VTLRSLVVLAVSQSKMEVEFGISLIIPAITCVAYFGRSNTKLKLTGILKSKEKKA
jgi:hypothetical protein